LADSNLYNIPVENRRQEYESSITISCNEMRFQRLEEISAVDEWDRCVLRATVESVPRFEWWWMRQ